MKKSKIITLKTVREMLTIGEGKNAKNSIIGMHIAGLHKNDHTMSAETHCVEITLEILAKMLENGIDVIGGEEYKMGSVSKAFYQLKLDKFKDF